MGIFLGLTAALCFGGADFFARLSCRRIGNYQTFFFTQFSGFIVLTILLAITREFGRLMYLQDWQAWIWAMIAALINIVSYLALYRAFEIGLLALVSPIGSSYATITVMLAVLSGEKLSLLSGFGIAASLVGIILAALRLERKKTEQAKTEVLSGQKNVSAGVSWALAAAFGFGIALWLLGKEVTPVLGGFMPTWLFHLLSLGLLVPFSALTRLPLQIPQQSLWGPIVGIGLLETSALTASMLGLMTGQIAVVSVLASLHSTVVVVSGWFLLKERLLWNQWTGIFLILIGIILVNL
jgi:drug/metabolite transporter (DMT)-like permease